MVWGTNLEKNCPCSNGHLLILGGVKACQDALDALMSRQIGPKESAPECSVECEGVGGSNRYLGNAQM